MIFRWIAPFLGLLACVGLSAADSQQITAPAQNWVLPLFSPQGFRSLTLRGDQARLAQKDRIDVTNIRVDIFSGDAASQLTTIVLSSEATYVPSLSIASGPASVRIIRSVDGTDASGEDWSYDFKHENVSIHRHVRVVFRQALKDFLK